MIRKVYANKPKFKEITFKAGLNVVLADRRSDSSLKDTRNGAGKTTLLNIIRFCLGSDHKNISLPIDIFSDWEFYIDLDIAGVCLSVMRSLGNPNSIAVSGEAEDLLKRVDIKTSAIEDGKHILTVDNWKKFLALYLFGIDPNSSVKNAPTFSGAISYFIRRSSDAYISPFLHFKNQKTGNSQIMNAFLLGLKWENLLVAEEIREKSKALRFDATRKADSKISRGELEAEYPSDSLLGFHFESGKKS